MTWRTASRHVIPVEDEINGQGQTDYLFSLEEVKANFLMLIWRIGLFGIMF
jgi:hypothetical protein